jgi:hypothetical protein
MTDLNNSFSQPNPYTNIVNMNPSGVPTTPQNSDYSLTDQTNGPKIDDIYQILSKFFKSYQVLADNYEFIISTNNDYYSKFVNTLQTNNTGLNVGAINNQILSPYQEKQLYNQPQTTLIDTIKKQNSYLLKCRQHFTQLNNLLISAKGTLERQKQTQVDMSNRSRSVIRAIQNNDPQLLDRLSTIIPVVSKPNVSSPNISTKKTDNPAPLIGKENNYIQLSDSSLFSGNLDNPTQSSDIYNQEATEMAQRMSTDSRLRARGAEQNSRESRPMMASTSTTLPNNHYSNNTPFLNPSEFLNTNLRSNPLIPLEYSSGQNMSPNQNTFRELESVEMISVGKEKGLVLSGQPISGSGDYFRYPVLFEQDKQTILKYINNNSLRRIDYPAVSANLRGKINFISKSNIISDFNSLKNEAQSIWEQNESNRTAALSMIQDLGRKENIIQYGIFKLKKTMTHLSPSTEDVFFIKDIPQGFENNNLIKFSFPKSVEKGLHSVEIYVIQLATANPQNTQFYNIPPNDIIRELMRQWVIFIQRLFEKKKQLQVIYEREFEDIKGLTSQAFKRGIRGQIKNIGIRMIGEEEAQNHGLTRDTNDIPSEPEYRFFEGMLQLSLGLVSDMKKLLEAYNRFDLQQDRSNQYNLNPLPSDLDYTPLGGGGGIHQSKKNKVKKKKHILYSRAIKSHKNPKRNQL